MASGPPPPPDDKRVSIPVPMNTPRQIADRLRAFEQYVSDELRLIADAVDALK